MRIFVTILAIAVFIGSFYIFNSRFAVAPIINTASPANPTYSPQAGVPGVANVPIAGAKARLIKKFFGTFVTPQNSPIQPEKFTGYHTGVDFETFPGEENKEIDVLAFCDGILALKEYAQGYGGVVVEKCNLDGQAVTIVYGHLSLVSIVAVKGTTLKRGDKIGILGKGYSTETDGERKHLHFGIHKGTAIDIKGYVQKKSDLSSWIDPATVL